MDISDEIKPKSRKNVEPTARELAAQSGYVPVYNQPSPRRSSEDRPNSFNPVAWVVDGATGVVEEVRRSDLGLSEEFWIHFYAMRREGLLAARAAVDSLLMKFEKGSQQVQDQLQREARRGEIPIE